MSFFDRISKGAPPREVPSEIAATTAPTTSETDSGTLSPTIPFGPAASSGGDTTGPTPQPAASEAKYSRTSAISRLEEALTKTALTWSEMLGDPNVDAKTKVEMFKLASDHLSKLRRAGGDDDDPDTKSKLPGIDALRELMEGTAEKKVRGMMERHHRRARHPHPARVQASGRPAERDRAEAPRAPGGRLA